MSLLIEALAGRHGLPTVDETTVEAFLAPAAGEPPHALLFFTGDPASRTDSDDVAVVLPELLAAYRGRLRAAVVARAAEAALKPRFRVEVLPSLVLTRGADPLGVMPRIRDWSDYRATIDRLLDPAAPVLDGPPAPRVRINAGNRRIEP